MPNSIRQAKGAGEALQGKAFRKKPKLSRVTQSVTAIVRPNGTTIRPDRAKCAIGAANSTSKEGKPCVRDYVCQHV